LHTKVFCFSHPRPTALVGSFNPACDRPEQDPEVLRAIGDHDRGHNMLVELSEPVLVEGLVRHVRHLHAVKHGRFEHFDLCNNVPLRGSEAEAHFWPRVRADPIRILLGRFGQGARVRIAASHIKGPGVVRSMTKLARRGAEVRILAASSSRRVAKDTLKKLLDAGASVCRVPEPDGVPMHLKFLLIEEHDQRYCVFGSYNWTFRAHWLNHEIAVISRDTQLFDAFGARWEDLWAEHAR
jgi:phosphatidylserine/phosphatidylglycerophosphate/cardiolipin synthase-like enzyme